MTGITSKWQAMGDGPLFGAQRLPLAVLPDGQNGQRRLKEGAL